MIEYVQVIQSVSRFVGYLFVCFFVSEKSSPYRKKIGLNTELLLNYRVNQIEIEVFADNHFDS